MNSFPGLHQVPSKLFAAVPRLELLSDMNFRFMRMLNTNEPKMITIKQTKGIFMPKNLQGSRSTKVRSAPSAGEPGSGNVRLLGVDFSECRRRSFVSRLRSANGLTKKTGIYKELWTLSGDLKRK